MLLLEKFSFSANFELAPSVIINLLKPIVSGVLGKIIFDGDSAESISTSILSIIYIFSFLLHKSLK